MSAFDPATRTKTVARILGPYFLVVGTALLTRPQMFVAMLPDFMQQSGLVFVSGAFTLLAGLILLSVHHHWSSPAAIVITLAGIAASLKAIWLMLAPEWGAELTNTFVASSIAMMASGLVEVLLGAYLSFVGWFAKSA